MKRDDFARVKAGDTLYLAEPDGWNAVRVKDYTVVKVAPKGQITCECDGHIIKFTPNGSIIGAGQWKRSYFVTADRAKELRLRARDTTWFLAIRNEIEYMDQAARQKNFDAVILAFEKITQEIQIRQAQNDTPDAP